MAPTKAIRVKTIRTSGLMEILQKKIAVTDKLLRKFYKSKLSVDKILYKEARNTVQALIKDKKRKLLQEKLSKTKRKL